MPTTTVAVKSNNQITTVFPKPFYYDEYLSLMHAIDGKNSTEIDRILHQSTHVKEIVNYQNPQRELETPLHFVFNIYRENCSSSIIEKLCSFGAIPNLIDKRNETAYMMAERCNNWPKIKSIFDNQTQNLKKSAENNETGLILYQQQKFLITIGMLISTPLSGVLARVWKEVSRRNEKQCPHLPNIIFYFLKPVSLAIVSAGMNCLLVGNAASVGIEDVLLSFAFYLGTSYFALMFAQLGEKFTKKIQNKVLKLLIPILLYTFYLNPNLLFNLLNEAFEKKDFQAIMMPLSATLCSGVLFKAGEYGARKVISKFFPVNTAGSNTSNPDYFLRFSKVDDSDLNLTSTDINGVMEEQQLSTFANLPPPPTVEELQILCGENNKSYEQQNQQASTFAHIRRI